MHKTYITIKKYNIMTEIYVKFNGFTRRIANVPLTWANLMCYMIFQQFYQLSLFTLLFFFFSFLELKSRLAFVWTKFEPYFPLHSVRARFILTRLSYSSGLRCPCLCQSLQATGYLPCPLSHFYFSTRDSKELTTCILPWVVFFLTQTIIFR